MREQEPDIVVLVTTSSSTVEAHCSEDDHRNQKICLHPITLKSFAL